LNIQLPTLAAVMDDLARKWWVTMQRGAGLARRITEHVHRCETDMGKAVH